MASGFPHPQVGSGAGHSGEHAVRSICPSIRPGCALGSGPVVGKEEWGWGLVGFRVTLSQSPPQVLSDEHAREMCQRFADMECKLGEIDRARAIYSYCSQICDPRVRVPG